MTASASRWILVALATSLLLAGAACAADWDGDADVDTDVDGDADTDTDGDTDTDTDTDTDADTDADGDADADGDLAPPAGGTSGGAGGGAAAGETRVTAAGGVTYRIIAPGGGGPHPLMIVFSGTEGGAVMAANLSGGAAAYAGCGDFVFAVLDGVDYRGDGQAGAYVLDDVRALYDIDNDRTYLLSESAGTTAGLALGLDLRQSWFAAYWANDVNATATPAASAAELGFAPYGNAGPGGDFTDASSLVAGMRAAGYRTPAPAPYDGPGADTHGSTEQFLAALQWFPGKTRQE